MEGQDYPVEWDYNIPIFTNRFMYQDFAKIAVAIAVFFACLFGGFSIARKVEYGEFFRPGPSKLSEEFFFALSFVGFVLICSIILILILLRNRFATHFVVASDGVRAGPTETQYRTNTRINRFLIILGILLGKPGAVGTGLISQASQSISIEWADVDRVKSFPNLRAIALYNSWRRLLVVYCKDEVTYETALRYARDGTTRTGEARKTCVAASRRTFLSGMFRVMGLILMTLYASASPLLDSSVALWILFGISLLAFFSPRSVKPVVGVGVLLCATVVTFIMVRNGLEVRQFTAGFGAFTYLGRIVRGDRVPEFLVSCAAIVGFLVYGWTNIRAARGRGVSRDGDRDRSKVGRGYGAAGLILMCFVALFVGYAGWWHMFRSPAVLNRMPDQLPPLRDEPGDTLEMRRFKTLYNESLRAFEVYRSAPEGEKKRAYGAYKRAMDAMTAAQEEMTKKMLGEEEEEEPLHGDDGDEEPLLDKPLKVR